VQGSAVDHEERISDLYTDEGEGVLPPLTISSRPAGAESGAIICDDPDVPIPIRGVTG